VFGIINSGAQGDLFVPITTKSKPPSSQSRPPGVGPLKVADGASVVINCSSGDDQNRQQLQPGQRCQKTNEEDQRSPKKPPHCTTLLGLIGFLRGLMLLRVRITPTSLPANFLCCTWFRFTCCLIFNSLSKATLCICLFDSDAPEPGQSVQRVPRALPGLRIHLCPREEAFHSGAAQV
jgi:hypothetical protein